MYSQEQIKSLNKDIEKFEQVFPVTSDMNKTFSNIQQLVMLDRYAFKDTEKKTLKIGDVVVLTVKEDPKFPTRGIGVVHDINWDDSTAIVRVNEEYLDALTEDEQQLG